MPEELRADPEALIRLAEACLSAAVTVGDPYRDRLPELTVPDDAFGDLPGSPRVAELSGLLLESAGGAVLAHVQVLEGDADRLVQTAFAYRAADIAADQRMGGSRRPGL